jgi:uncharacterized protein HemX
MENQELAPQDTVASVGAPESAAGELAALKDLAGGNATLTVVLALIAVVGGKAGWKFFSDRAKLKHEEKMKEMELQAKAASDAAKVKSRVEAIKEKVRKVKKEKS